MKVKLKAWFNELSDGFLWLLPDKKPPSKNWKRVAKKDKTVDVADPLPIKKK